MSARPPTEAEWIGQELQAAVSVLSMSELIDLQVRIASGEVDDPWEVPEEVWSTMIATQGKHAAIMTLAFKCRTERERRERGRR